MEELIKQTDISISGIQKVAILLAELGEYGQEHDAADKVLANLDLSTDEIQKIRIAMKNLGRYNPDSAFQANRESAVLEELLSFGKAKGIFIKTTPSIKPNAYSKRDTNNIASIVKDNPDAILSVIKNWLSDKEE